MDKAEEIAKKLAEEINDGYGSADSIAAALRAYGDEKYKKGFEDGKNENDTWY